MNWLFSFRPVELGQIAIRFRFTYLSSAVRRPMVAFFIEFLLLRNDKAG